VRRSGWVRTGIAGLALVSALPVAAALQVAGTGASAGAATSATSPACTFNGSSLPIVTGASAGEQIRVDCTGLPALHPYLFLETSLLLGIDPKAAPLLSGDIVSVQGLFAVLAALPEINLGAVSLQTSDLFGDLDFTYTLPSSKAPDPNAVCPPTTAQIDAGLIGCGLAAIDLTSFKPVGGASAVVEYTGDPLFPPGPTLALGVTKAKVGSTVSVSDAPGATTFWWLSTLLTLEALLGGGTAPTPTTTVTISAGGPSVTAPNDVTVSPAVYNESVLTPPKISGGFTVPKGVNGPATVSVSYGATLLGFPLSNRASAPLRIRK
jgi:hypothetical protein